jgi:hypothetical protein
MMRSSSGYRCDRSVRAKRRMSTDEIASKITHTSILAWFLESVVRFWLKGGN